MVSNWFCNTRENVKGIEVLLRRSAQVALRACALLASDAKSAPRPARELAVEMGLGGSYVSKVLHDLILANLVEGVRGPKGGVKLARPAGDVRLWDVLEAVQTMGELDRCLLGQKACDEGRPCPLHEDWNPIRTQIQDLFESKNLTALVEGSGARGATIEPKDVFGEKA